jgi:ubiquinone biosynthesis protein UbiJ
MTDSLELVLRPITKLLNRNIRATTPARELCAQLNGTLVAVRIRDTALAMYFAVGDGSIALLSDTDAVPDVVITGSLLTLAKMAGNTGEQAIRDGALDLTGDASTARAFQRLLRLAAPDVEEELSGIIGDVAAHRLGEAARGLRNWARDARSTMGGNIREYVQEESRDVPSRYETNRFSSQVDSLRDDVDRLEARLNRLDQPGDAS